MANTTDEFKELEKFFQGAKLPESIQLDAGVFIHDVKKFIEGYLAALGTGEMSEVAAVGRYYRMT